MCLVLKYNFSINSILDRRNDFKHKICYKPKYSFLKIKSTPTQALTTRLMTQGKFLKVYKLCKRFYTFFFLKKYIRTLPLDTVILYLIAKYRSFRDFDNILFWRIRQVDCMFNIKYTRAAKPKKSKKKKFKLKKKKFKRGLIHHITGVHRHMLILKWIKLLILSSRKRQHNMSIAMFRPVINFLTAQDTNHRVTRLKLAIYKLKLAKLLQ